MQITLLGSGSKGNCAVLTYQQQNLLIDAGFSGAETARRLQAIGLTPADISGLLITHEHSDHIKGARVIGNNWQIPVYTNTATAEVLKAKEQAPDRFVKFMTGQPFLLGGLKITPFPLPHDAADPVGYAFEADGKKIVIATDLGTPNAVVNHHLKNAQVMIVESNYHLPALQEANRPWRLKQRIMSRIGHLSNDDASIVLESTVGPNTHTVIMGHISGDCNSHDWVLNQALSTLQKMHRTDINLLTASQDQPTGPFSAE